MLTDAITYEEAPPPGFAAVIEIRDSDSFASSVFTGVLVVFGAITRITVCCALTFTMLALPACREGPGSSRDTMAGETAETSSGDELMSQAEHDRRVDYIELLASNIEETKRFYSEIFGWEFTDYGPDYTSFTDGRLAGGFSRAPEVTAGGPLVVIYSTNLAEIEAQVRENGGRIVREVFEFPGGRRFHFTDPSGNELAVWSDR